jgi:hypothetical protein
VRQGAPAPRASADRVVLRPARQDGEEDADVPVAALQAGADAASCSSSRTASIFQGPYREETVVLSALDDSLVLFFVAELLHTVRLTIRNQTLDAEPFLVVGLIAGIRRVLVVTAEAERSFRWHVEGVEPLILAGLILVMATVVYVWRRSTRPGDYFPLQEARRSPSPAPSPTSVRGS